MNTGTTGQSNYTYEELDAIAKKILGKLTKKVSPELGIVCGSGLGGLAKMVKDAEVIPYKDIKGFPISTVPGHEGKLVFGTLSGKQVVLMQGRAHCYEGYTPQLVVLPIRVMLLMGVKMLIVTNAAGGINRSYKVGDIMVIKDHLNLAGFSGTNPLVGPNDDRFGPRFPPMSNAYDRSLRKLALETAKELGFGDFTREGVYSMMVGPSFETVTECRFLETVGVDATGMSTVPEVLVAHHAGIRVLGMSLITNCCVMEYDSDNKANHEEVLETGVMRSKDMQTLVEKVVEKMSL